jgi:hypothetical protein
MAKKLPVDTNKRAKAMVDLVTGGEVEKEQSEQDAIKLLSPH